MLDPVPWLPTITAVVAAVVAGVFAWRANASNLAAQRVRELERRLATQRLEIFKPLIDAMAAYMVPGTVSASENQKRQKVFMDATKNFLTWVQIFGSDDSVRTYHRMMQASFASAPPPVMLRLYGQLMLAARRDVGDSATSVTLVDLLGLRIKDLYDGSMAGDMRMPDEDFYRKVGWQPPWDR